jgi:hypothetical protein
LVPGTITRPRNRNPRGPARRERRFSADGTILRLDIEGASRLGLGTLEAIDIPLTALKAAE